MEVPGGVVTRGMPWRRATGSRPEAASRVRGGHTATSSCRSSETATSSSRGARSSVRPSSLRPSSTIATTAPSSSGAAMRTAIPGLALRNPPTRRPSGSAASVGSATMSRVPLWRSRTVATDSNTASRSRVSWRAGPTNARPASVSSTLRPRRWNRRTPSSASSRRIPSESDGWLTSIDAAALVKLPLFDHREDVFDLTKIHRYCSMVATGQTRLDLWAVPALYAMVNAHLLLGVALIGLGVGFLSGAFGKGGSALATPLPARDRCAGDPRDRITTAGDDPVDAGSPAARIRARATSTVAFFVSACRSGFPRRLPAPSLDALDSGRTADRRDRHRRARVRHSHSAHAQLHAPAADGRARDDGARARGRRGSSRSSRACSATAAGSCSRRCS